MVETYYGIYIVTDGRYDQGRLVCSLSEDYMALLKEFIRGIYSTYYEERELEVVVLRSQEGDNFPKKLPFSEKEGE